MNIPSRPRKLDEISKYLLKKNYTLHRRLANNMNTPGRPRKLNNPIRYTIILEAATLQLLKELCMKYGVDIQDEIRDMIDEYIKLYGDMENG